MFFRDDFMADKFSKETRSYIMSRIRGKDTKPEILGTLSQRFLFVSISSLEGLDFERMIKDILDVLMLYCQNIRLLSLFMAVFGIFMRDASTLKCQSPMLSIGRRNSIKIENVMHAIKKSLKLWDGLFSLCGSAN